MADIKQDPLSLQYSEQFGIQGIQEANIDLELPPRRHPPARYTAPLPTVPRPFPTPPSSSSTAPVCPTSIPSPTARALFP